MINSDEQTMKDKDRGYTDEQREAVLKEPHMQTPSPWMKIVRNPWPSKNTS